MTANKPSQKSRVMASPPSRTLSQKSRVMPSPPSLSQKSRVMASPPSLSQKSRVMASPPSLSQKSRVMPSPPSLSQKSRVMPSPPSLSQKSRVMASPPSLRPHGDGLHELSRGGADPYRLSPHVGEDPPLLRTRGYVILRGNWGGSVGSAFDSGLIPLLVRVPPAELNILAFPPVLRDWVIKGLGMSSLVYATGHIN